MDNGRPISFFGVVMADPFIKINKKMLDELLDKFADRLRPAARSIWLYLLIYANYKDNGKLKRGQIFIGRKHLSEETLTSEKTVRTVTDALIFNGFLAEKSGQQTANQQQKSGQQTASRVTNRGTILTIVNYDTWVMNEIESNQQNGQQTANQQQKSGQQTATQEVRKELKEENKETESPPPTPKPVSANADIDRVTAHYKDKVLGTARMTDGAKKKIIARLKRFSVEELCTAMDKFNADTWWMENNAHRGLKWFFNSDDRIDQFLNLKEREPVPKPATPVLFRYDQKAIDRNRKAN